MYTPVQIGIPRTHEQSIAYQEYSPTDDLQGIAYCFWTLRVTRPFAEDFSYFVLPDGCIDIIFDVTDKPEFKGALVMTPSTQGEQISIRPDFSYSGIRLQPGAWCGEPMEVVGKADFYDFLGTYDLRAARQRLADGAAAKIPLILDAIARELQEHELVQPSPFVAALLGKEHLSVEDLIASSGYSRRQLQRVLRSSVGYSPHDFLKIMRFQRALQSGKDAARQYSDQSHFIRECKRVTGMTPSQLRTTYRLADSSNQE